jgi:hypothetical protein
VSVHVPATPTAWLAKDSLLKVGGNSLGKYPLVSKLMRVAIFFEETLSPLGEPTFK